MRPSTLSPLMVNATLWPMWNMASAPVGDAVETGEVGEDDSDVMAVLMGGVKIGVSLDAAVDRVASLAAADAVMLWWWW